MSEPEEIDGAAINLNFLSSERSGEGKIETVRGAAVYFSGLTGRINRLGSLLRFVFILPCNSATYFTNRKCSKGLEV